MNFSRFYQLEQLLHRKVTLYRIPECYINLWVIHMIRQDCEIIREDQNDLFIQIMIGERKRTRKRTILQKDLKT